MDNKDRQKIYIACCGCVFLSLLTIIVAAVLLFGWDAKLSQLADFDLNSISNNSISDEAKQNNIQRESDIRQIALAMELAYDDDAKYPASVGVPTKIASSQTTHLETIPKDPAGGSYLWKDNTDNPQNYCVAAELEGTSGYFICNQDGCGQDVKECE